MAFLNSILKNSSNHKTPFEHWELNQPLTDLQVQEIVNADIANPIEPVSYTHLTLPTTPYV